MKQPLLVAALAALLASPLAAADHLLRFDGWRMTNATDYFLEDLRGVLPSDISGEGLSAARSFTVMATLTCPETFNDYAGALSLGVPGETQLTLTFPGANADGRAYLSASGDDVLPGTWFVPAEAFSTARDGGRTLSLALGWDAPAQTPTLCLAGAWPAPPPWGQAPGTGPGPSAMRAPPGRPRFDPPAMASLSRLVYLWSIRYSHAAMKSSKTFCFLSSMPARCHFSPYSLPPRRFTDT